MTNFKKKKHVGLAISSIGYSHIKNGTCCQDKSAYLSSYSYQAIVVCDGHGGNKHFRSQIGAEYAINVCREIYSSFAKQISKDKNEMPLLKDLEKCLIFKWREKIAIHLKEHPITQEEYAICSEMDIKEVNNDPIIIYGTTIISAIICNNKLFVFQLGDGDARIITNNGVERLFEKDSMFVMGRTTSLCNQDAFSYIKDKIIPMNNIRCCFISTDGVGNSFSNDSYFDSFIESVYTEIKVNNFHFVTNELKEFLPKLSSGGSGDDVSIAILK